MPTAFTGIILITTIFCGIAALLVYHYKRLPLYVAAGKLPGPLAFPIIGNALYFLGDTRNSLSKINELFNSYPNPFRVWIAHRLTFWFYEPEHIKTIMLSPACTDKEDLYKVGRPWLGTGLVTASGSKWRTHRKLINPTFHPKILESFVEVFNEHAEIMTLHMRKELGRNEFDVSKYVVRCTLDFICATAMGVKLGAQEGKAGGYVHAAQRMIEIMSTRMVNIWMHPGFIFKLTQLGKEQRKHIKYLHGITNDVIRKKKEAYNNAISLGNHNEYERSSTRNIFLDLLMELSTDGKKFTDEELREEVDTMMMADHDTTATIIHFVILMLANYPDVQERVYQELCEIYGDEVSSDLPIKHEDLNCMKYLERVIKETMRIFPMTPVLFRQTTDDLNVGEYNVPKGSTVVMGIMKLHRLEKYWPNPLLFDPDRFLPEECAKRHPYCYLPFSGGPRNCIGFQYAMMSMKVLIATVLRRYVLKKVKTVALEDVKLKIDIMLKPIEPLMIKITKR